MAKHLLKKNSSGGRSLGLSFICLFLPLCSAWIKPGHCSCDIWLGQGVSATPPPGIWRAWGTPGVAVSSAGLWLIPKYFSIGKISLWWVSTGGCSLSGAECCSTTQPGAWESCATAQGKTPAKPARRQSCWAEYSAFINKQDIWAAIRTWHLTCDCNCQLDFGGSLDALLSNFYHSLGSDTNQFGLGLADLTGIQPRGFHIALPFLTRPLHESCSVLYTAFSFRVVSLSLISVSCWAFACRSSPGCRSTSQPAVASPWLCQYVDSLCPFSQRGDEVISAFWCCTSLAGPGGPALCFRQCPWWVQ